MAYGLEHWLGKHKVQFPVIKPLVMLGRATCLNCPFTIIVKSLSTRGSYRDDDYKPTEILY